MRRLYQFILKFYPAKYRAAFATQMLATFDLAIIDSRQRGRLLRFAARELLGLLAGLLTEWSTKQTRDPQESNLPDEIADIHTHIQQLIRSMEFAIAHHDFPNARRYSDEERIARSRLDRLIRERWGLV